MNVILVPGLLTKVEFLSPLRERLEDEGLVTFGPGFAINMLVRDELALLRRRVHRLRPAILVGHSAGGYLSLKLAQEPDSGVVGVIGLGTLPLVRPCPPVPYYEAHSVWESVLPSCADETRTFLSLHSLLPYSRAVQGWVIEKVRAVVMEMGDLR